MTKRILTIAFVIGSLSLGACSSEPSDFRPEDKVSLDAVPPGTRSTPNLDNAQNKSSHDTQQRVQLNHDEHSNELKGGAKSIDKKEETTVKDSVANHQ